MLSQPYPSRSKSLFLLSGLVFPSDGFLSEATWPRARQKRPKLSSFYGTFHEICLFTRRLIFLIRLWQVTSLGALVGARCRPRVAWSISPFLSGISTHRPWLLPGGVIRLGASERGQIEATKQRISMRASECSQANSVAPWWHNLILKKLHRFR